MPTATAPYPVHVSAALDRPSRGLWLVKWLLVLPHYVVLAFLWLGFVVVSFVAFFAILFTGRYPRALFEYNVGVMRWSWRVSYYAYGALGTDRYPPFTLEDVPNYPAHLTVDYPQHLSRGLVLVKWWLLAIPHYVVVGFFVGGGAWLGRRSDRNWDWSWGSGGLVAVLVLVAAVVLLVTGSYPRPLFDVVLGMQRWALRVAGYAALMTDAYPPFRLDLGGDDPDRLTLPPGPAGPEAPSDISAGGTTALADRTTPREGRGRWTAGRVVALVVGAFLALAAMGPLIAGIALTAADHAGRDTDGYFTSPTTTVNSAGYAVTSDRLRLDTGGPGWAVPTRTLGTVRIRAVAGDAARPVFVGLAPTNQVNAYLAGVSRSVVDAFADGRASYVERSGGAPTSGPTAQTFWAAQASGGTATLTWKAAAGDWSVVVMNADGSLGVAAVVDAAATAPGVATLGIVLLVVGLVALAAGVIAIVAAAASGRTGPAGQTPPHMPSVT